MFMATVIALVLCFQNCGMGSPNDFSNRSSSTEETPGADILPASKEIPGRRPPQFSSIADLNLWRQRIWGAKCGPNLDYEVCFEGDGLAGDQQWAHLDWDNPIDDDWDSAQARILSWITGTDILHVDRTVTGYSNYTGHFWRRDEFLRASEGFEAEFRVRILSQSSDHGVKLHFYDDRDEFKIVFAPDSISFHQSITRADTETARITRRNTSWTVFRVLKTKNSGRVYLWADGTPLMADKTLSPGSTLSYLPATGELGKIAPRIGFGDNSAADQGAFEADYFRYRRDNRPSVRGPSVLPGNENCSSTYAWQILRKTSDLSSFADDQLGNQIPDSNSFGRTFEFDLQLLSSSAGRNPYSLEYTDKLGGVVLSIFPDHLEIKGSTKPYKPTILSITGFNGFAMNRYRLVRASNGLYWHLYLNDSPIPVAVDIHGSGTSPRVSPDPYVPRQMLLTGPFYTPALSELQPGLEYSARGSTEARAAITQIRWLPQALGANGCAGL